MVHQTADGHRYNAAVWAHLMSARTAHLLSDLMRFPCHLHPCCMLTCVWWCVLRVRQFCNLTVITAMKYSDVNVRLTMLPLTNAWLQCYDNGRSGRGASDDDDEENDDYDIPEFNDNVIAGRMWNDLVRMWQWFECKQIAVTCIVDVISWYVR